MSSSRLPTDPFSTCDDSAKHAIRFKAKCDPFTGVRDWSWGAEYNALEQRIPAKNRPIDHEANSLLVSRAPVDMFGDVRQRIEHHRISCKLTSPRQIVKASQSE